MPLPPDQLFRALSDPTRLRCMALLWDEGQLCVCELTHALQASQPKVSRHLAQLREFKLVLDERRGQWVHYRLADDLPDWVRGVLEQAATACRSETSPWRHDRERLHAMPHRPEIPCCTP